MLERGGELGFLDEPAAPLGIGDELGRQDFQRDEAVQPLVARLVDLAHAAGAEQRADLVRS